MHVERDIWQVQGSRHRLDEGKDPLMALVNKKEPCREPFQDHRLSRQILWLIWVSTTMTIPLQITFRQMDTSPALEARIRELVGRFERFSDNILRCHIIIEPLSGHSRQGALYEFRIALTLPDQEIAVCRTHPVDRAHEDPYVALRDTFRAARRKLQEYERKRRGDVKRHSTPAPGEPTTA